MRRLPAQRMLNYLIKTGVAQRIDMTQIAWRMAHFYRNCAPGDLTPLEYYGRFERDIEQSRLILREPSYRLPAEKTDSLSSAQQPGLRRMSRLLGERVCGHRIVEGHGDLRQEHICMESEPVVIDCLEFSPELRKIDTADGLAFLSLECERLGAPELGCALLKAYVKKSGDTVSPTLVHYYQSVRASLRARLTILHLSEEKFQYSAEWQRRCLHYLQLAEAHIAKVNGSPSS